MIIILVCFTSSKNKNHKNYVNGKKQAGENAKDKPEKYEIVSITKNNYAFGYLFLIKMLVKN